MIGSSNKGKSFILSKISKIDLPSGTSIRTEGLSIKYPDLETYTNRRIALLDSAGLETPVLKDDKSEEFEKVIDKKKELEETSDIEKIQNGEEKNELSKKKKIMKFQKKKKKKNYLKKNQEKKLLQNCFCKII